MHNNDNNVQDDFLRGVFGDVFDGAEHQSSAQKSALNDVHFCRAFECWSVDVLDDVARPYWIVGILVGLAITILPWVVLSYFIGSIGGLFYHLVFSGLFGLIAYRFIAYGGSEKPTTEAMAYIERERTRYFG
ncbi:hypothetical protein VRRI112168_03730 [Vreelandella rituensis]|uniref:Uncharacterized protein n=1 Tax=Vreelandella rituensis TaxID=2282306 RepID=A0A368U9Z1_9GAMM|nr:hypothetical protein [Halomonas rituensis]RCV93761.1 hypothetical protein DU506_00990 [Halomonas rituensis]